MPSCPISVGCTFAPGALLSSLVIAFGCMVVCWHWLGRGVLEGREKDTQGCPWGGQGRQGAGRPGTHRAWRLGFTPQMEDYRLGSAALQVLGSSTALGNR